MTVLDAPIAGRASRRPVGLYVHVPLCATRCRYCDFTSTTALESRDTVVASLAAELEALGARGGRPLETLYFGGGTPSLLREHELVTICDAIRRYFPLLPGAEATIEANPEDVSPSLVSVWRRLGFTRVSLGVQSFDADVLRRLGRRHSGERALAAAAAVVQEGLELSLDLMLGVPGGCRDHVAASVEEVLRVRPGHVSVYLFESDKPTPMARQAREMPEQFPTDEATARSYLEVGGTLVAAGYRHYEISNFALPGREARHNQRYWRGWQVLAAGPGAHGQAGRRRWANVSSIPRYVDLVASGRSPRAWSRRLDDDQAGRERLMVGLRLARGVAAGDILRAAPATFRERLDEFLALGLARRVGGRVRLTPRGWLVSNELLAYLV